MYNPQPARRKRRGRKRRRRKLDKDGNPIPKKIKKKRKGKKKGSTRKKKKKRAGSSRVGRIRNSHRDRRPMQDFIEPDEAEAEHAEEEADEDFTINVMVSSAEDEGSAALGEVNPGTPRNMYDSVKGRSTDKKKRLLANYEMY